MEDDIQYWLQLGESDMAAAETLHQAGHELQCLFFLEQAVEKTLKAHVTKRILSTPPRTHNLRKLADLCGFALKQEQLDLMETLSRFYVESRYPEAWGESPPDASSEKTARLIASTKEFVTWLRQQL